MWKSIAAGALGGLAAAFAMNQFENVWSIASKALSDGHQQQQTSNEIEEDSTVNAAKMISRNVFHHELTEDEKKWAGPLVHYGLGAELGAFYGALSEVMPAATTCRGLGYGTAVWLAGDEIAVPVLGLSKPDSEVPLSSHLNALGSHLVYGFVTELVLRLVR